MPKIFIASDHRGFEQKQALVDFLTNQHLSVVDLGPTNYDPDDDYPVFAKKVAEEVIGEDGACGILICGSAHGITIQANRYPGIRAVAAYSEDLAAVAREHNDANVLCLSADFTTLEENKKITMRFLAMPFSGESRHVRRLKMLDQPIQPRLSDAELILTEQL